jgi:internalin A
MPRVLEEAEEQGVIVASDYPLESHRFILELMRAFQLCYASETQDSVSYKDPQHQHAHNRSLDGGDSKPIRYLVPELLSEFEPEMKENWEESPVHLRYRYEVFSTGILPRFIVRTHALSESAPHWRHGVVLRHADAKVLVRAESDKPELHVFAQGGDADARRVLVTMVRRELESLNIEIRMHPVEELQLSGENRQWIGVRALREVEIPGEPRQKLPVQPEGTADIDVAKELEKLIPSMAREIERNPDVAPLPVRVFVSYAHDDERQLNRLDAILDVLEHQHGLAAWRDKRLIAGEEWSEEIKKRLESMDIFLFVASQTSIVRPYILNRELKKAKERHLVGQIEMVTVKLEPCACDEDPFLGKLQRLASKYKSVAEAPLKSAAWEQVRKDLLPVIERVRRTKLGVSTKE